MFEQEYYKRIVDKTSTPNRATVNTAKPWFPQLKHRLALKDYDYKFFVLPPNKMVSLLKKQKINIPSDEQIREFLKNHSLKHIVKYDIEEFKNVEKIQPSLSPSPIQKSPVSLHQRKLMVQPTSTKPRTAQFERKGSIREIKSHQIEIRPAKENISLPTDIKLELPQRRKLRIHDISAKSTPQLEKHFLPTHRKTNRVHHLMRCLKKIRLMGISIPELIERKAFCKKAFSTQFSKEFIFAAKQNRLEEMQSFLITHPFLVFAYDYYNMTALHYACKLGFVSMVRMLLHYHADFDAIDLMNRTPLSIAISENQSEVARMLLNHGAYPWSTALVDLSQPLNRNPNQRKVVSQARRLQLFTKWSKMREPVLGLC